MASLLMAPQHLLLTASLLVAPQYLLLTASLLAAPQRPYKLAPRAFKPCKLVTSCFQVLASCSRAPLYVVFASKPVGGV